MKYPDDFNTPAFPAGKFVAVSRFMATAVMVLFFVIVCLCGIILWTKKTQDVSPFLISFRPNGERWTMVAHNNHRTEIPAYYVLQESLLNRFVHSWFTISDDILENQANWAECSHDNPECTGTDDSISDSCTIYCASNDTVFKAFKDIVLPTYSQLETENDAVWHVKGLYIRPLYSMDSITENGGLWRLNILVKTNTGVIRFIGFATVEYDKNKYPKTMGYYVADFNTYRVD